MNTHTYKLTNLQTTIYCCVRSGWSPVHWVETIRGEVKAMLTSYYTLVPCIVENSYCWETFNLQDYWLLVPASQQYPETHWKWMIKHNKQILLKFKKLGRFWKVHCLGPWKMSKIIWPKQNNVCFLKKNMRILMVLCFIEKKFQRKIF